MKRRAWAGAVALFAALGTGSLWGQEKLYSFGVITQRSPILTAQYWNPILRYVSEKSGVPLVLKLAKTGPEHSAMIGRGEFDFIYSNHNFKADNDVVGYRVIARPREEAIQGQIVVLASSDIQSLQALEGREVVFPSQVAFVGYYVPMDALLRAGITVKPLFAGNQEGAMGQLKAGRVVAAGVNSQIMRDFAHREQVEYRVLWSSEKYLNIPISVHPSVPKDKVAKVREALIHMAADPEGARILAASAELVKQKPPYGFVAAEDAEFDNVRRFYRTSLVKGE
ncbi:phosphate/phosphite/phosphonate ABC transporter substrate-binding protein [Pelomicrobium sp.]|jgi:phosphonate transport system substrate-binding protein|uniref:phosphate/phosphite/phosphonate ABC transporter substrate-binding protein n=1 Tax=Pelomicrobium sp. TaxID=2815319 RepID=UPI002FDD9CA6